jgi:hypothetical protein
MPFNLSGLKSLHEDMASKNEDSAIFPVAVRNKGFSCIFLSNVSPYLLFITSLGLDPFTMEFTVQSDYSIISYLGDKYDLLRNYLDLHGKSNYPYLPNGFFTDFNSGIPTAFHNRPPYTVKLLTASRTREIDEANKIYFCGWYQNPVGKHVTPKNYEKTLLAFGKDTADRNMANNHSSKWTDNPDEENLQLLNQS